MMNTYPALGELLLQLDGDRYLRQVLGRYPAGASLLDVLALRGRIEPVMRAWAGPFLRGIEVSGSNAKGTAVGGQTDMDLFISISHDVPHTLSQIYWKLFQRAGEAGWTPRPQNVSIGVQVMAHKIDLVPARVQLGYVNRHSLYRRKADSWTQTDVAKHINLVRNSGRLEEIRLTKIWRLLRGLEFPSLALELAVIQATHGRRVGALAANFREVLRYLGDEFRTARLIDPANTANVVSDDLTQGERMAIVAAARSARPGMEWGRIVW